jgi:hypothetical protein
VIWQRTHVCDTGFACRSGWPAWTAQCLNCRSIDQFTRGCTEQGWAPIAEEDRLPGTSTMWADRHQLGHL